MQLTPFQFEANTVRTCTAEDGTPLFCGKDVAAALGYSDTVNALKQHCRGVVNHHPIVDALGRVQQARFIAEPDLYRLISGSKLPAALQFEQWVFGTVLPQIRRTGSYGVAAPKDMIEALTLALEQARQLEAQKAQLEAQRPAVSFVEAYVSERDYVMSIRELAKVLRQKERALVKFLLDQKILIRNARKRLEPYARVSHYCVIMPIENKKTGHTGDQVMFSRAGQMHVAKLLDNQQIKQPGLALRGGV